MKKPLFLITVLLILGIIASTTLAFPDPKIHPNKEPVDKITFIHYKNGNTKAVLPKRTVCYSLLGIKWRALPISYVVNPTNSGFSNDQDVLNAINAATYEWDRNTNAGLFITPNFTDTKADWDNSTPDGVNEYVFGEWPDLDVISVTNIWYTRRSRQIVDYDVLFNTNFYWADCTVAGTNCSKAMDLQNIATHETGHGIGLDDVYSNACSTVTMYGYSWYGDIGKRDLAPADITGLQMLYGK